MKVEVNQRALSNKEHIFIYHLDLKLNLRQHNPLNIFLRARNEKGCFIFLLCRGSRSGAF